MDTDLSLRNLNLNRRWYNALVRGGVKTLGELLEVLAKEEPHVRRIGEKGWQEIRKELEGFLGTIKDQIIVQTKPQVESSENLQGGEEISAVHNAPIEVLELSNLAYRRLKYAKINSIAQILEMSNDDLLNIPYVGPTLLAEIREKAAAWINHSGYKQLGFTLVQKSKTKNVPSEMDIVNWISLLDDRRAQVVCMRFGLESEPQTLDMIGQKMGITRERVRQLEARALKKLKAPSSLERIRSHISLLTQIISNAGGIITEKRIATELIKHISFHKFKPEGVERLVMSVDKIFVHIPQLNAWGLVGPQIEQTSLVLSTLKFILEKKASPLSLFDLISTFSSEWTDTSDSPDDVFVLALLLCAVENGTLLMKEDGTIGLLKWENHIIDEIVTVLRQIGRPAHFTVIAEKVNSLLINSKRTNPHNIHNILGRYPGLFIRVGQGIFGLAEWGLYEDRSLADAAYRILKEAGKPLHINTIISGVLRTWQVQPSSVYIAVENNDRINRVGRSVYALREHLQEVTEKNNYKDFGELYGDQLAHWQAELDKQQDKPETDFRIEVDKIRGMGLDFFIG